MAGHAAIGRCNAQLVVGGCKLLISRYNGAARRQAGFVMVGPAGPLATISREPGQARKGAAAAVTLCAGVWLVGFTSITTVVSPLSLFV